MIAGMKYGVLLVCGIPVQVHRCYAGLVRRKHCACGIFIQFPGFQGNGQL